MKKFLMLLLLMLAICALAACGEKEDDGCDHEYSEWEIIQEADCQNEAVKARTCEECGRTQKKTIDGLGDHKEESLPAVEATCTETGLTEGKRCSVCLEVLQEQLTTPATGHLEEVTPAVEATCTETGLTEGKHCAHCGVVLQQQVLVPTTDHSYLEEIIQAPTCQSDGTARYTCEHCGVALNTVLTMPSYTATEVHNMTAASVGEVLTYDASGNMLGLGSCFVMESDGVVVTNYHVIQGAYSATVTLDGNVYQVQLVLGYDAGYDLAVLQLNATGLQPLPVCKQTHAVGETVYAFGSSQGLTATFSQGIISYANREVDGVQCVQHDASISPGNSGGPLINRFGEVIGVNTFYLSDSQNLNFAVSMAELDKLDMSNPVTLDQIAAEKTQAFAVLKEYLLNNGQWYEEDNEYSAVMEAVVSESGNQYITYYNYDLEYQEVELCITVDWEIFLYFYMDEEGVYGWEYWDDYGDSMYGYLDPAEFAEGVMLPYDDYTLNDLDTAQELCEYASYLADLLVYWMNFDLAELGIPLTSADIGFIQY